jgi:hypothetical protein
VFATYFNGNAQYPTLKLTDAASVAVWKGFVAKSGSSAPGPAPAPSSPAPSPSGTATSPAADHPVVSGLALSPSAFAARPQEHTAITFSLNQASDVTALVLDQTGTMVRTLARPAQAPGSHTIRYYGFNGSGHRVPAGKYQVLVVASNAHGSGTAESPLEIDAP